MWSLPTLVPHWLRMEPLEPLCKASTGEKILLLLGGVERAAGWGAGLPSTYPSFLCLVCPHDYNFLLSLQLFSAFPTRSFLFYDFNINDLLRSVIPQTAQPAIKIRFLKSIAKLNRGGKCTLSSKKQNGDSRQSTTPGTCVIHAMVHLAACHTMRAFSSHNHSLPKSNQPFGGQKAK